MPNAVVRTYRDVRDATSKMRAELAVSFALLVGWCLITYGIATITRPIAWAFSFGLLLLLLCGWRMLWSLFSDGLYVLTRKQTDGE
jgi:cytochrome b561